MLLHRADGPLGLKLISDDHHRGARVLGIVPGSQADLNKEICVGDRIHAINGVPLSDVAHHRYMQL